MFSIGVIGYCYDMDSCDSFDPLGVHGISFSINYATLLLMQADSKRWLYLLYVQLISMHIWCKIAYKIDNTVACFLWHMVRLLKLDTR